MPCKTPKLAFRDLLGELPIRVHSGKTYRQNDGKTHYRKGLNWEAFSLPCGKCLHCRLQLARAKAIRCVHQAKQSNYNCFLTLTYDNAHIPGDGSYNKNHPVAFVKKLRDKLCRDLGCRIKYSSLDTGKVRSFYIHRCPKIKTFGCAEYGEQLSRPHFHLIIFGWYPPDAKYKELSGNRWSEKTNKIYTSEILTKLWEHGFHSIGDLTLESAQYVAGYVTKKIGGERAKDHYKNLPPERTICNSQGIGLEWLKKYYFDLLINNSVVHNGKELPIPTFYIRKLKDIDPVCYEELKKIRIDAIKYIDLDSTRDRVLTRYQIQEKMFSEKKRSYENAT